MNNDAWIQIRISQDDKERWKKQASQAGKTLSEWIRMRCEAQLSKPPKTKYCQHYIALGGRCHRCPQGVAQ